LLEVAEQQGDHGLHCQAESSFPRDVERLAGRINRILQDVLDAGKAGFALAAALRVAALVARLAFAEEPAAALKPFALTFVAQHEELLDEIHNEEHVSSIANHKRVGAGLAVRSVIVTSDDYSAEAEQRNVYRN
jgi:hypothetical protein